MTDIVPVPQLRLSSRFPTNADRPSGQWNNVVVQWGETTRTMSSDLHAVAQNVLNNATAANERAAAAQAAQGVATTEANRATAQADAAMGYRNTASAHATTATTQAGIATTKAGEAAASAAQANSSKIAAQQIADNAQTQTTAAVQQATTQAVRAETAASSIASGPITSLTVNSGVKTGAVTLALSDMGDQATDAQMQSGDLVTPLLMSPANVRAAVLANSRIQRVARTSNTQLQAADSGKLIDITSGTFTQTFAAVATLGDGWWCYLQNSGTGDITLDPNGAELIDGLTSYIMYPGECRLVQCDGVALRTVVLNAFYRVFTASGTFTKPPGYMAFDGLARSGAQSGAKSGSTTIAADGGRGGGCFPFSIDADRFSTSTVITIGSGGAASTSITQNAGGNTSLGSLLTVYGAGVAAASIPGSVLRATVGPGGAFTGSSGVNADGLSSVYGGGNVHFPSSEQGSSVYGGAAGGCVSNSGSTVSTAGTSAFAGNGGAASSSASGTDGAVPSGGGGATQTGATSGAGARGELRIWGII